MGELKIVVLVKPVPDPACYDRIEIDPATGSLARQGMPAVLNPADKHALEAALQLRERFGGRAVMLSMAPESAVETLKEGLAMGADEACVLSDRAFAASDSLATSRVLAAGIRKIGPFDLVLAGNESADGGTVHVPSQVGELLGVSHLANVIRLEVTPGGRVAARTRIENGYMEVEGALPMVVGVRREINTPRYTSLMGVLAAQSKPVRVWGADDLGIRAADVGMEGSSMRPGRLSRPAFRRKGELLEGGPDEVARRIVAILRAEGVLG
ncbi:MAG: electron transfer flavoprotein subunit beta/FixA family protein [Deltaproteobacteria bacterium]|nr:electron transfer flavoprotein subunit beta/FixA family protein [Deltaproteobacteria bacterium]